MLHFLYTWQTYRNLKQGFLLDFFFKRICLGLMHFLFSSFSLFFWDKFLIEYISKLPLMVYTIFFTYISSAIRLSYLNLLVFMVSILIIFSLIYILIF